MVKNSQPIAIALSGGGARGWSHIGVLQAMEEFNRPPAFIAGCSSGAIVGALYAAGHAPAAILSLAQSISLWRFLRPILSNKGLFSLKPLEKWLSKHLPSTFEELTLPLVINATNLKTNQSVYFSEGPLLPPILASSCLPVLFKPVTIGGQRHFDGGILDNLPIGALPIEGYERWASACNYANPRQEMNNYARIIEKSLRLVVDQNTLALRSGCHLVIDPPAMEGFRVFDQHKCQEIYEAGYTYAKHKIACV